MQHLEPLSPAPAMNSEILVERQNPRFVTDLGAANQAGIGKRRRQVEVLSQCPLNCRPVFVNSKDDVEQPPAPSLTMSAGPAGSSLESRWEASTSTASQVRNGGAYERDRALARS